MGFKGCLKDVKIVVCVNFDALIYYGALHLDVLALMFFYQYYVALHLDVLPVLYSTNIPVRCTCVVLTCNICYQYYGALHLDVLLVLYSKRVGR